MELDDPFKILCNANQSVILRSDLFSMTSQRYSLLTPSLSANPKWIPDSCSPSSLSCPGHPRLLLGCLETVLLAHTFCFCFFLLLLLSCTVSQLPEPSLFAGWTASMAWRALSLDRCLFGIFCLPQCDGSEMKSSFYSSVNGCTWFAAMMHIPGGQAVTLPDFFF